MVPVPESVASSAVKSAWDLNAPLIICLSDSGNTVRFVSKYRPHSTILCITSCARTAKQVLLSRFVHPVVQVSDFFLRSAFPLLVDSMHQTEKLIEHGIEYAKQNGLVKTGDYVITTAGVLEGVSGSTNLMRVTVVP